MLLLYIFLSLLSATLVMTRVRLDPMLVVMPCVLLLSPSLTTLWSVFFSLMPVMLCLAMLELVRQRQHLNVENMTRFAAGLSLGGFVGIQLAAIFVSSSVTLILMLLGLTCVALLMTRLKRLDVLQVPVAWQLWSGLGLGALQSLGFSSGRAVLQSRNPETSRADHYALWAFSLVGILVGLVALPPESHIALSWQPAVTISGGLAALCGTLIRSRINISSFESNVLRWTVLLVCLSIWVHLGLKFFIYTP